jgi:hypothetical protein
LQLAGIAEFEPHGLIIGFVPIPNGDFATSSFAFGDIVLLRM